MKNSDLENAKEMKYIGIVMVKNLTFIQHCLYVKNKLTKNIILTKNWKLLK